MCGIWPIRVNVKYTLRADALAAQKLFVLKLVDRGTVELAGNAQWAGAADYAVTGTLHAYNFYVRSGAHASSTHARMARWWRIRSSSNCVACVIPELLMEFPWLAA